MLERIPDVVGRLVNLKKFSAQRNEIQDMNALLECKNLEMINLRTNKIASLPIDLPLKLPKLQSCRHAGNPAS